MTGARVIPAVGLIAAGVIGACFSEREATAPTQGACNLPLGADVPGSTIVAIRDFSFQPAEVRIHAGQKVTWVNCEDNPEPHTSTADAGTWDSSVLAPGQAFTHTFDAVGTSPYFCTLHPSMTARVIVE